MESEKNNTQPKEATTSSTAVNILNSLAWLTLIYCWFGFASMAVMALVMMTPSAILTTLYVWLYPAWFVLPLTRMASKYSKRGEEKKAIALAVVPIALNCSYHAMLFVVSLPLLIL